MEWQILINIGLFLLLVHAHLQLRVMRITFLMLIEKAHTALEALIECLDEPKEKTKSVDQSMNNSNNE